MIKPLHLMIPGPVDVDPEVLFELGRPVSPHFGVSWLQDFNCTLNLLRPLFGTEGDVILMPGPGTGALDAALSSLIPANDGVCVVSNGFFGDRLLQQARAFGIHTYSISFAEGLAVDASRVRKDLEHLVPLAREQGSAIRALAIVHHETSTGILNPLHEVATVASDFQLPVIVDAVASLGGAELRVDDWGIDVCVGVPNKCLGALAGVAIVSVSKRAWALADKNSTPHGWYHDLRTWAWYKENWPDRPYPTTLPTNTVMALKKALELIHAFGVEAHMAEFLIASERVRSQMQRIGFDLFPSPKVAAPMLSVFRPADGVTVKNLIDFVYKRHRILIADGLAGQEGKIVRVGHMGEARRRECGDLLVEGVAAFLDLNG